MEVFKYLKKNEIMSQYCTYEIGGPADYFYDVHDEKELVAVQKWATEASLPIFRMGKGSNLLISDRGIRGLVIHMGDAFSRCRLLLDYEKTNTLKDAFINLAYMNIQRQTSGVAQDLSQVTQILDDTFFSKTQSQKLSYLKACGFDFNDYVFLDVQAGADLREISKLSADLSLAGLTFACGIPGTVGGAIYMNAGAYGHAMEEVLCMSRYMDHEGNIKTLDYAAHQFSYRHSFYSDKTVQILSGVFALKKGKRQSLLEIIDDLTQRRNGSQPLEYPSAGSVFKRPSGYFAGKLITEANLKGYRIGGAEVSQKHAGFIINVEKTASSSDVSALIHEIQMKVYLDTGVLLEVEQRFVGDFLPEEYPYAYFREDERLQQLKLI